MNILGMKLISGEDVIGEVESESEREVVLENPVSIVYLQKPGNEPGLDFAPFPMYAATKKGMTVFINRRNIVYTYEPAENFSSSYKSIFGSGLIVPPQKSLITG